ncbi:nucleotide sugar dehydrogenase [Mucilaginibacter conchicola]|uniref:Nucleotide sugar dehydrogenase n=1 Tax=Mucilaginibacter conchicola TaxID=2303333 RepID=A0A372NZ40_9SPHI|nr:nucleotide sugar dehydrogenase [Mucilaginibacter conchicola]RFZ95378.1 nucleotide sugar dehydrogenase [Mucilaginibacter conchicola]
MSVHTKDIDYPGQFKIAVVGLGYVGLPLAIEFARKYQVVGYDKDLVRIAELKDGTDRTLEFDTATLKEVTGCKDDKYKLLFSDQPADLADCNVFIVTVPTPLNQFKSPDLKHLVKASKMIGKMLKKNDLVIYESTVYPGCTEEDCVPVLEKHSGLTYNVDFFCGYSPERINPGDKVNTLTTIKKVTSGSTPQIATVVDNLYASIITAGTHKAPNIKVAEASKAIENAQRDINISFVNELALIFDRMGIDTSDVLEAAGTKWNFLKYKPGLVGGHCIGVDPYYLAHKAETLGYHPEVILSGRRINDNMGVFVSNKVIKLLIKKGNKVAGARALILGLTFKENCPDIRNTKVIDIYHELKQVGVAVDIYDPWASPAQVKADYKIGLIKDINDTYDAIILAVAHHEFSDIDFSKLVKGDNSVIYDTKSFLPRSIVDGRL